MSKIRRHTEKRNYYAVIFPILTIIVIGIVLVFSSSYEKSWTYNWTGIRQQVKDSVGLAENLGISSGAVGINAIKPSQYDRRHWIMENATEYELLKLTEYPEGTIKTIAYEGLIRNPKFENKVDLINSAINDTEYPIRFQSGCEGTTMNIGEYLVGFVLYIDDKSPPPPIDLGNHYGLSENERIKILVEYRKVASL